MIHFPRGSCRWRLAAAASAAAGATLLAACGGPASAPASATISGTKVAGFPGNTGTPSALATARPSPSMSMSGMPASAAPAATAPPVSADAVTILNFAFGPQAVKVKAGTTVHWTNHDAEAHTVTSNAGTFGSPVLQPGAGYSFTFTKPGTYHYHCTIHPFMTGTVTVS